MNEEMIVQLCERIDGLVRELEQAQARLASLERENEELHAQLGFYRRRIAA